MKRDNKKELDKDKKACWLKEAIKIDKGKQPWKGEQQKEVEVRNHPK